MTSRLLVNQSPEYDSSTGPDPGSVLSSSHRGKTEVHGVTVQFTVHIVQVITLVKLYKIIL